MNTIYEFPELKLSPQRVFQPTNCVCRRRQLPNFLFLTNYTELQVLIRQDVSGARVRGGGK